MIRFKRYLVPIVASLSMIGPFAIDTYLPSFPEMASDLAVTQAMIAQSLAIFLIAFAVGTLAWGPLIDAYGRKKMVMVSLAGFGAASLICVFAPDFQILMWGRLFQGLLASGSMIAGQSIVRDLFSGVEARKIMSQVMLMFVIAPAIAPIIGGWLHELWGWRSVFIFLAVFGFTIALLVLWIGRETLEPEHKQSIHPKSILISYRKALTHPKFIGLILAISFTFGGMFIYIAGAATLIYDFLKLGANDFAVQFVPVVAGMMLGSVWVNRQAHKISIERMAWIGFAIMLSAAFMNLLVEECLPISPWSVITPLVFYAIGVAVALPNLVILSMDCFPKNRGMANALRTFMQMGTNGLVAGLVVPLVMASLLYYAIGLLGFALLGFVAFWIQTRILSHKIE